MIIVTSFELIHNILTGIFKIITKEIASCPLCGGELAYRDTRLRKLKNLFGETRHFLLRRLRCEECKALHTEIPDIIQPYKHYESEVIQKVLDESVDVDKCTADDSTVRRWKSDFAKAAPDIAQRLTAVYAQMADKEVPIEAAAKILDNIKSKTTRWLPFVMSLLINKGFKICTQFAFSPILSPDRISLGSQKRQTKGE